MEEIDFIWDSSTYTYHANLKLKDNTARIFFSRNFGSIKKEKYLGWIWNVGLAIGKKKDINNWYYSNEKTPLNNLPTFGQYGIQVLIWAKDAILQFIEQECNDYNILAVEAADSRRWNVYKRGLKDFKIRTVKYGYNYDFYYNYQEGEDFYYKKSLVYFKKKGEF